MISGGKRTNNQYTFLDFIKEGLQHGIITSGDVIVMDNATIHKGKGMKAELEDLKQKFGFQIRFLPPYAPELNPIELVFGWVKEKLRKFYEFETPFLEQIISFFSQFPFKILLSFYIKCFSQTFC